MSDRPKIWAHCAAGCLWETVHKDEFLASASIKKIAENVVEPDRLYLDIDKKYKFEPLPIGDNIGIVITCPRVGSTAVSYITFGFTGYDKLKYTVFDLLDIVRVASPTTGAPYEYDIIAEVNGVRKVVHIYGSDNELDLDFSKMQMYVTGASVVYMYNSAAEILFTPQVTEQTNESGTTAIIE